MPRTNEIAAILRSRILTSVHLGHAGDLEKLPGVRALAKEFDADHRTILAALHRLADEGIVEMRPRSGNYVALPQAWPLLPDTSDEWLVDSFLAAFRRRVSPKELAESVIKVTTPVRRALCIESTHEQRRMLCDGSHLAYGFDPLEMDVANLEAESDRIAQADIVVTTMFYMAEVTRVAKRVGRPVFMMSIDAEIGREIRRLLAQGLVYFIATDPRVAAKIDMALRSTGLSVNARLWLVGLDDAEAIPPDAPVFIFPTAVPLMKGLPVLDRAVILRYAFPETVARHLVRWLIRKDNGEYHSIK